MSYGYYGHVALLILYTAESAQHGTVHTASAVHYITQVDSEYIT